MICCCAAIVAKIALGIINTVLLLIGLAMFTIGLVIQQSASFSKSVLSSTLQKLETSASSAGVTLDTSNFSMAHLFLGLSIALMATGLVLSALCVLGLIATKYSLKPLLIVYFIITLVLFLIQLIVVLIIVINRDVFNESVKPHLRNTITNDFTGIQGTDATTLMWNGIMVKMECCGVDSYNDFTSATSWTKTVNSVSYALVTPIACCKTLSTNYNCAISPSDSDNNWNTGCYDKMWNAVMNLGIVPSVIAVLLAAQLAILILTVIIIKSLWSPIGVV